MEIQTIIISNKKGRERKLINGNELLKKVNEQIALENNEDEKKKAFDKILSELNIDAVHELNENLRGLPLIAELNLLEHIIVRPIEPYYKHHNISELIITINLNIDENSSIVTISYNTQHNGFEYCSLGLLFESESVKEILELFVYRCIKAGWKG